MSSSEVSQKLDLSNPEFKEYWKKLSVLDKQCEINWFNLALDNNTLDLRVSGSGNGGLKEMMRHINQSSKVNFGVLSIIAHDRRGEVESYRKRIVMISWVGNMVPSRVKMLVIGFSQQLERSLLKGSTVTIHATRQEDIKRKDITSRLLKAGGAHQPSVFEYGPDDFFRVDERKSMDMFDENDEDDD